MSAQSAPSRSRTLLRATLAWVLGSFVGLVLVVGAVVGLALTLDTMWAILLFSPQLYYDLAAVNALGALLAAMAVRFTPFARPRFRTIVLFAAAFTFVGGAALIEYTIKFGDLP